MIHKLGQKTPVIDKDAFIEESAHVIGDAVIEKDCSVWFYTSWAMRVSLSPGQKSMGGISGSV